MEKNYKVKTPIKAIREKCLDCCCGHTKSVAECSAKKCSLWPYRFGHRPKLQDTMNIKAVEDGEAGISEAIDG